MRMTNLQVVQVFIIAFELWIFRSLVWNALSCSKIVWNFIFHRKYFFQKNLCICWLRLAKKCLLQEILSVKYKRLKFLLSQMFFFSGLQIPFSFWKNIFKKLKLLTETLMKNYSLKLSASLKCFVDLTDVSKLQCNVLQSNFFICCSHCTKNEVFHSRFLNFFVAFF